MVYFAEKLFENLSTENTFFKCKTSERENTRFFQRQRTSGNFKHQKVSLSKNPYEELVYIEKYADLLLVIRDDHEVEGFVPLRYTDVAACIKKLLPVSASQCSSWLQPSERTANLFARSHVRC